MNSDPHTGIMAYLPSILEKVDIEKKAPDIDLWAGERPTATEGQNLVLSIHVPVNSSYT